MPKSLNNNICEEAAFKEVYNTYADDVHNYLYYKYGTQYSPRDKAQEAFIKLWDNCKKVTFAKAKSFLFTVANNLMLNEIKHQKIVLKHQQQQPKHFSNESPEFLMEEAQYLERYNLVLSNMKEEYRVAFFNE